MTVAFKTSATDWGIFESESVQRLESKFMLCLLRLNSWPNLNDIHVELVDAISRVCTLLEKRPMVGFLIARRLNLPIEKTHALLNLLHSNGHVVSVGAEFVSKQITSKHADEGDGNDHFANVENMTESDDDTTSIAKNSDDILAQLWRVMNTDIFGGNESPDLLGQVWRVLETEITLKKKSNDNVLQSSPVYLYQASADDANAVNSGKLSQLWEVLNSEITLKMPPAKRTS